MPKSTKIEVVEDFPQQYNGFDCGLYTLMASDALINNKAWYDPTAERMREKIINIID
jgi:Ulp1 family protease